MATLTVLRASATVKRTIKDSEGLELNSYEDTAVPPVWTVGYGHAAKNPRPVRGLLNGEYYEGPPARGVTITLSEAQRLFEADTADSEAILSRSLNLPPGVELSQCQVDALIEFLHQYGPNNFRDSTLLIKVNQNPNNLGNDTNPGILHEFERWNRAGGVRNEETYRRSLRRACIYAGVPIPAKLWSKNGIPFALDGDGNIDHSVTPTAFQIVEQSRKASTKPKFEPEYPRKAEPTIIETPAVEISPPVVAKAEPPIQQPPSPGGSADPIKEPAKDKPPPVAAPPLPKDAAPVNVTDPKDMVLSRRFWGLLVTGIGTTNFLPRAATEWISNEGNRELLTWIVVVAIGFGLYKYGQRKASRPLK